MAEITKEQVVDWLSSQSVIEVAEIVKELEEKWGVSAAAPAAVAVAAPAGGGDAGGGEADGPGLRTHLAVLPVFSILTQGAEADQPLLDGEAGNTVPCGKNENGANDARLVQSAGGQTKALTLTPKGYTGPQFAADQVAVKIARGTI